jgi:hypothetical protein
MRRITRDLFIVVVLFCAMAGIATAATVTPNINYQGKLADNSGNPLTGTYSITFKLYDSSSGVTPLQTITQPTVQCTSGIFNTNLAFSSSYFDGRALWLGIAVGSDAEMTPRQELRPVPYALSLRPNAHITLSDAGVALRADISHYGDRGFDVFSTGENSAGFFSQSGTYGNMGLEVFSLGNSNTGAYISSTGQNNDGINIRSTGSDSTGVKINMSNTDSPGIDIVTHGPSSFGVKAFTYNTGSPGFYAETQNTGSQGFAANTYGADSPGVDVAGWGSGTSYGIKAYSANNHAIYADTGDATKYGVYTPDRMYASAFNVPTADVAEYMPVTKDVTPGTVMIIGEDGKLAESTMAYDIRVAGIVSTAPGVSLGTKDTGNPGEEQIAVAGRVPCKVDASYGAIHPGDVLTTSPDPGYAMKAEPVDIGGIKIYRPGTVLGKAMGTLEDGTGVIEVLVTLQ